MQKILAISMGITIVASILTNNSDVGLFFGSTSVIVGNIALAIATISDKIAPKDR